MTNKRLIVYHDQCLDGIAAAWAARKHLDQSDIGGYKACNYDDPWSVTLREILLVADMEKIDTVMLVDFSFKAYQFEELKQYDLDVEVIDHHKTAWEDLNQLSLWLDFNYDVNECGATLTWKTLAPSLPVPPLLQYVRDRDIWIKELPYTEEVYLALWSFYNKENILKTFSKFDILGDMDQQTFLDTVLPIGKNLLDARNQLVEDICKRSELRDILGYKAVPYVELLTAEEYKVRSEVGHKLYKSYPSSQFSATTYCTASGLIWSLRSDKDQDDDFDVSAIAKSHGGGGHRNAAGFKQSLQQETLSPTPEAQVSSF